MSSQVAAAHHSIQTYLHEAQIHNLILDPQAWQCVCVCVFCVSVRLKTYLFCEICKNSNPILFEPIKKSTKGLPKRIIPRRVV